jgi:hypothetical protein
MCGLVFFVKGCGLRVAGWFWKDPIKPKKKLQNVKNMQHTIFFLREQSKTTRNPQPATFYLLI